MHLQLASVHRSCLCPSVSRAGHRPPWFERDLRRHAQCAAAGKTSLDQQSEKPSWAARMPTWSPSTRMHLNHLMDLFTICDKDGNGILDREEVWNLLQSDGRCTSGLCMIAQHRWLSEEDLDDIMACYDSTGRGGLSFSEFMELVLDGVLLDGTMDEYRAVFSAVDENGDGHLCQEEMTEVLQQLGRPVSPEEVAQVMNAADLDGNALIDFNEFLRLFRTQLLDLPRLLRYMKMKPMVYPDCIEGSVDRLAGVATTLCAVPRLVQVLGDEAPAAAAAMGDEAPAAAAAMGDEAPAAAAAAMARSLTSGGLTVVSGEQQLDAVMSQLPPNTLLVTMFGLSSNPLCQSTAQAVQALAQQYHKAVFVSVEIDRSPAAKALFKQTLLGRYVPAFYFFRGEQLLHSHADASAAILEKYLREHLSAKEQPVQPVYPQQVQGSQSQQQAGQQARSAPLMGYSLADLVYDSL